MWASLVDASTNDVLRQTSIDAIPGYTPVSRTLTFPRYVVSKNQRLILQLQVASFERRYVILGLTHPQSVYANLELNGVPDAGDGPLAFAHLKNGSEFRAALLGNPAGRTRLALAVIVSGLAILAHPRVAAGLRRVGVALRTPARRLPTWWQRLRRRGAEQAHDSRQTMFSRIIATPWYPWPTVAIPILYFLTSNPLHFATSEILVPLGVALVVVSAGVVGFRTFLKDWHRPAAATVAITVVFFVYGHVDRALNGKIEEPLLFGAAVMLGGAAVAVIVRARRSAADWTQFLNLAVAVLLVFQVTNLAQVELLHRRAESEVVAVNKLPLDLLPAGIPDVSAERPDIYYIILDAYARNDELGNFDNAEFMNDLQSRGFYIASEATSNYGTSALSITSALNMQYISDLGYLDTAKESELLHAVSNHNLAAILQRLGYAYIHLESGYGLTNKAPSADISVVFTPAGAFSNHGSEDEVYSTRYFDNTDNESLLHGRFVRELIDTTALRVVAGDRFLPGADVPFTWWAAGRAIQMFDFLSKPIDVGKPKFVFAHIIKPHIPATFDRYGNRSVGESVHDGFDDSHDPSVPDAYIGQLIYINSLVLKMVDGILQNSSIEPIIVIAGDHGRSLEGTDRYAILAAFHMPNGGQDALYSSISSVNHFRAILDVYFDLGIGLIEDRIL